MIFTLMRCAVGGAKLKQNKIKNQLSHMHISGEIRAKYFPQLSLLTCDRQQEMVGFRHLRATGNTLCDLGGRAAWIERAGGSTYDAVMFAHWCYRTQSILKTGL